MDDLSVSELLTGLVTKEYEEYRLALLQHLTNFLADHPTLDSETELVSVLKTLLILLTTTNSSSDDKRMQINMALCALNNATTTEESIAVFLRVLGESLSQETFRDKFHRCIEAYLSYNPQLEDDSEEVSPEAWEVLDEWQHLGSLLCNIAQTEEGRKIVLQQSKGYMEKLIVQVRSHNSTRRRGAVGCIRRYT